MIYRLVYHQILDILQKTLIFLVILDRNTAHQLNNKIRNWPDQWKMNFNPDPFKQPQEVIIS